MRGRKRSIEGNDSALIQSVNALSQEVNVLRDAIDDLRIELQYMVRNPREANCGEPVERFHVTSLALNPSAPDFGDRVNAVSVGTVAELRDSLIAAQDEKPAATSQRGLFGSP